MCLGPSNGPKESPRVAVGLPVRNGQAFLDRALRSLAAQTYPNFEIIISNNASTDTTEEICRRYETRREIRYFSHPTNIGITENFRFVLEQAAGEYFMWAAADDYWTPDFIEKLVQELRSHPEAGACMSAATRVFPSGDVLDNVRHSSPHLDPNQLGHMDLAVRLAQGSLHHFYMYGLFRRDVIRNAYQSVPNVRAGDRILVCHLALFTRFRYVDELLYFRQVYREDLAARYSHEDIGSLWSDRFGNIKTWFRLIPVIGLSTFVPLRRKLILPVLLVFFAGYCFPKSIGRVLKLLKFGWRFRHRHLWD